MVNSDNNQEVRDNVVAYQQEKGLTDQQMADMMGCNRRTYQQTRTGKMKVGNAFTRGASYLFADQTVRKRVSGVMKRATGETDITLELAIDGTGKWEIDTGIFMFDHLLSQIIKHGRFDLTLRATFDDPHHMIEDVAILLGQAFSKALGDRKGIVRMADATVPLDEAVSTVAIDLSGRPYWVLDLAFNNNDMKDVPSDLVRHFLESFAIEARLNIYAKILCGINDHHRAESLFKALGRALDMATTLDERTRGISPSTKGMLEGAG